MTGCNESSQAEDPTVLVINGYNVPPVPDKTINDSTIYGVDSDNNGIRDDVDRFIAETYPEPLEHAVAELNARTFIDVFKDPKNAYEKKLYLSESIYIYCKVYIEDFYKEPDYEQIDNKIINTKERELAFWTYNGSLGGNIFTSMSTGTDADCPAEIINLLKK